MPAIAKAFGHDAIFVPTDWVDVAEAKAAIDAAPEGSVLVLENTRFHPGRRKERSRACRPPWPRSVISTSTTPSPRRNRAHASTEGVAHILPSGAGTAMAAELTALEAGLGNPQPSRSSPSSAAPRSSTKIDLLENLITKVEALVLGGGMANTFLYAQGVGIGNSLCEKDLADTARRILEKAEKIGCAIILPVDAKVAWHFEANAPHRLYGIDAVDGDGMILDVGPQSMERIIGAIDDAHTVVWNGPLGAFELTPFDEGTTELAKHVAQRTKEGKLVSVAGGGDTVGALAHAGVKDDLTYVSTAGGAFLEWMEGKTLPGVAALQA